MGGYFRYALCSVDVLGELVSAEGHDERTQLAEVAPGETGADEDGIRLTLTASSLTAWQIKDVIAALIVVGLLFGLAQLPFAPQAVKSNLAVIALLCLAPSAVEVLVLNSVRHRHYSLHLYPERLVVSQGWVFRQVVTIPRSSILNLRFRRGPILRRLGLMSVSIMTIADQHKIGPLDAAQTKLIERFVNGDLT